MTRQAILAIVIGVIIVLGAAAAILYSKTQQTPEEEANVAAQEVTPESGMMSRTLVDLLRNQENVRCTFSTASELGETSGTVYVSGENMRGDFDITTENGTESTYMIKSGDTFYMWGDSFTTGVKMVMNIQDWAQSAGETQPTGTPQTFDPNAPVDFKCAGWTVDSSLFKEPADVEFISFEGLMMPTGTISDETESSDAMSETNTTDQCSICNSLTGDAKSVCLEQLNCQ